jgi:rRNA maturation endonuclease Nob1
VKVKKKGVGGLPLEVTEYAYWSRFLINRRFAYFVKGEKYCKKCEYVFKPTWSWDKCPSCGSALRRTPRHNKRWKLKVSWSPDKMVRE